MAATCQGGDDKSIFGIFGLDGTITASAGGQYLFLPPLGETINRDGPGGFHCAISVL